MAFKRKLYSNLLKWKNESQGKTALLIEGARRVGKTTLVKEFGRNEYKSFLIIDFSVDINLFKEVFKKGLRNLNEFFFLCLLYLVLHSMKEKR
jgi:predicted AAA+ superfamily ATPase